MDYATLQNILGCAAVCAALAGGGIVGVMLVYDLGKPLWSRLARLWRRSPVECVAAVALLCYCVAWGGGKITFPRTTIEYELLKDAGSEVTGNAVTVVYTRHALLPDLADIQLWRRPAASTNDADWVMCASNSVAAWSSPQIYEYADATNQRWVVFTTWTPSPAVQTNGVFHIGWIGTNGTESVLGVPKQTSIYRNGALIAPKKQAREGDE